MKDIQPADVYERVEHLYSVVIWLARLIALLCFVIVAQIFAKGIIFTRVLRLLNRVEALLVLAERHGVMSDDKANELKANTVAAAKAVVASVKSVGAEIKAEVPPKVMEAIKNDAKDVTDSAILKQSPLGE